MYEQSFQDILPAGNAIPLTPTEKEIGNVGDSEFHENVVKMNKQLLELTGGNRGRLFKVKATNLPEMYLGAFPDARERALSNCTCCKKFLHMYGDVVVVDETTGRVKSAIWFDGATGPYEKSFSTLKSAVESARLLEPFRPTTDELQDDKTVGYSTTKKQWIHFRLDLDKKMVLSSRNAGKEIGDVKTSHDVLSETVRRFKIETLRNALTLFENDAVFRAENFIEPLKWMIGFIEKLDQFKSTQGAYSNLIWNAAGTKPIGFTRLLNNVLQEFLADLENGVDTTYALTMHKSRLNPTKYQRPQSPAAAGQIAAAEKLIAELDLASALDRRPLRKDEVKYYWQAPAAVDAEQSAGVFGKLIPKGETRAPADGVKLIDVPNQKMTLAKFMDKILPEATKVELKTNISTGYITYLTAKDPDAKPIVRWDHPEERNPVSWFFLNTPTSPETVGLESGHFMNVTGLAKPPSYWGRGDSIEHPGMTFVLEDYAPRFQSGSCLFPEILIPQLHSIRATIEQHSKETRIDFEENGPCAGGFHYTNKHGDIMLRVTTKTSILSITIDRED